MRRLLKPAAIGLAAVVVLLLLAPLAARLAVHAGLAAAGFKNGGGSVTLGLHGGRIERLRLGEKSEVTAKVTYSLGSLLHGRVETVEISDARLSGVVALNGAIAFDGYIPSGETKPGGPISLPADIVTIRNARLELETPLGKTGITVAGELLPGADGLHLTGMASIAGGEISGIAPVDFRLSASGWTVSLNPFRLSFPPAPGKPATDAAGYLTLAAANGAPLTGEAQLDGRDLSLAGVPVRTLSVRFKTGADGPSASLKLAPADGGAGIDGTVESRAGSVAAKATVAIGDIAPVAKAAGWSGVSGPVKANLALNVGPADGPRPLTLDAAYDGAIPGGSVLRGAKLKAAATYDGARNALTLTGCNAFSADTATISGFVLAKIAGCVGQKDDQPLFAQDAAGNTAIAAKVANFTAMAATAELKLSSVQASVKLGDIGPPAIDATLDGGDATLNALGSGLKGMGARLTASIDGALSGSLSGKFAAVAPNGASLPVAGTIGGTTSAPNLALSVGSILKASVTGQSARADMPATEIGEKGADLLRLMPGLAISASKLSGSLAFHAEADWSNAKTTSKGTVSAKDIAATTPNFTVEGVNADVALPSLMPVTIAEKQKLTIKVLNVGLPLTDGQVVFSMNRNRILNIDSAEWSVAGGTVGTYDQQLDLYGPDQHFGIVVRNVDLAQVLKLVDVNGLSAEGTLAGAIPLRHTKDTILVQHGYLQTRGAGVIRYDPADTPSFLQGQPGEGTAILRDALKDFHYQQLGITIDGVLGGDEQIKMSLKGANPKLYGGVPVSLNVNLSGALDSIARTSVEAYTRPAATIRKTLDKKTGEKK